MVEVAFDAATKKVSFTDESLEGLDPAEQEKAVEATRLVNELMTELVACDSDVPPPPNQLSPKVTSALIKLHASGVRALASKKPEEAVKLLSTALEMGLRRPRWESTMKTLDEVANCLVPRCDAYIMMKDWSKAYADVSMLSLIKAGDPGNHFRRGVILANSGRRDEGIEFLRLAVAADPQMPLFRAVLEKVEQEAN